MSFERKDIVEVRKKNGKPLLLDGAIGTQLIERGIEQDNNLWTSLANINSPKIVENVYGDYINAGADIITTNTFRTNPAATKIYGKVFAEKMIEASLDIARNAAENKDILIAGSNPPAEDCYQAKRMLDKNELQENHDEHITLLWKYGADFILNETQSHFDEIMVVCEICAQRDIPFVVSMLIDENLKLLSGEHIKNVLPEIERFNPIAVGINCVHPNVFKNYLSKVDDKYNFGFYLNVGHSSHAVGVITDILSPDEYLESIKEFINGDILFVGSCCGSSPKHTKKLRIYLDSLH